MMSFPTNTLPCCVGTSTWMAVPTLLNDVEIADGIAKTITAAITSELHERQLSMDNLSTLSADGASTFSGHKTGVGV